MKINIQQDAAKGMTTVIACTNYIKGSTWHVPNAYKQMAEVKLSNVRFDSSGLKARCNSFPWLT